MSKTIVELLKAKEPMFSIALKQLEDASGNKGVDVKLTAEILQKAHDRMKRLGLDPADTAGKELYNALINQAEKHDLHLAESIGGKNPDDVNEMVPLAIDAIKKTEMPTDCWAIKEDIAREFLRQTPPPKIMERLGYDSVDEMLEKEDLFELYGALRFAEDGEWLNAFIEHYKSISADDFETREIKLVVMPKERWGDIAEKFIKKKRHLNTHLKEMGVVLILPAHEEHMKGITTKIMSLTYHYYNEVRLYSAFFKLQRKKPNFAEIFVDTLIADPSEAANMAGNKLHWRVIQRYYGKLKDEYHPEVFEPHVQPEDLHWRRAEELMYQVAPELEFWEEMDYVALMQDDGRPLTFNLMDVSLSYSNEIPYEDRYIYHFTEALWNEVFIRYMGEDILKDQILKQLDNDLIAPENLSTD